jgi:hypothetical protein
MSATEINRNFYPINQEEGQEAYCLAGSASCPDSSKNPNPITIGTIGRKEVKRQR